MLIQRIHEIVLQPRVSWLRSPFSVALLMAGVSVAYGISIAQMIPLLYLVALPCVLVIVFIAIERPELAATGLLVLTWSYISENANTYYGVPSLSKPLVVFLIVYLLMRRFLGSRKAFVQDQTIWWMVGYFVVVCLGLGYASYPEDTMLLVVDFGKNLLLFLVLINLISEIPLFERAIWLLIAMGALLGTLALVQEVTHRYDLDFGGLARAKKGAQIAEGWSNRPRAGGPTREPLVFGQQLLVLVPVGLWGIRHGRKGSVRVCAAYAVVLCIIGIGLSFSRSSYVSLAVVMVLVAMYMRIKVRFVLLLCPILLGLLSIVSPEVTARFATLEYMLPTEQDINSENQGINSDVSYRMRAVQIQMAWQMFLDHPLLGIGGRNFSKLYPRYLERNGSAITTSFGPPHNYYLGVATEHGVLGLSMVGGILVLAARRLRFAYLVFVEHCQYRMADLVAALSIGFIGYLISAFFLHGLYSRLLWLQVTMAITLALIAQRTMLQATRENFGDDSIQPNSLCNQP